MYSNMSRFFVNLLLIASFYNVFGMERKLTTRVNPGCSDCSSFSPFIHVSADSDIDTIHHLWDFKGKPSVLVAHTLLNTSLSINWKTYPASRSLNFSSNPLYTFTAIFDKVIDFNDVNNTGIYKNKSKNEAHMYSLENFKWNLTSIHNDSRIAQVTLVGTKYSNSGSPRTPQQLGVVKVKLSAFGIKEHSKAEPHLFHTTNTSQVEFNLENMTASFAQSRYAFELIAVTSDKSDSPVSLAAHKTIDDEHSPGIFTVAEYLTAGSKSGSYGGGYLQWRTVGYTSRERAMVNSTVTHESAPFTLSHPAPEIERTVIYSLKGPRADDMNVHAFYVSFGAPDDKGYYAKTNYLSWSLLIGYGQPAGETFSLLFVILISIGLNLVSLLAVVAYVLIVTRRLRRNKNDLFFSH